MRHSVIVISAYKHTHTHINNVTTCWLDRKQNQTFSQVCVFVTVLMDVQFVCVWLVAFVFMSAHSISITVNLRKVRIGQYVCVRACVYVRVCV